MGFPRQRGLNRPSGLETPDSQVVTTPLLVLNGNGLLFLRVFMSLKDPDEKV